MALAATNHDQVICGHLKLFLSPFPSKSEAVKLLSSSVAEPCEYNYQYIAELISYRRLQEYEMPLSHIHLQQLAGSTPVSLDAAFQPSPNAQAGSRTDIP